jgi:hypothetical protein
MTLGAGGPSSDSVSPVTGGPGSQSTAWSWSEEFQWLKPRCSVPGRDARTPQRETAHGTVRRPSMNRRTCASNFVDPDPLGNRCTSEARARRVGGLPRPCVDAENGEKRDGPGERRFARYVRGPEAS